MNPPSLTWARVAEHYADLPGDADHFLALNEAGVEIGVVKLVPAPAGKEWMWSMLLTNPGLAFRHPTSGQCATHGQAARELGACYAAFRAYYGIED